MADHFFHRPDLAEQLSARILSDAVLSPVRSGLFLAAPRRTGKSTFLCENLIPALEKKGRRSALCRPLGRQEVLSRPSEDALAATVQALQAHPAVDAALIKPAGEAQRQAQ